MIWQHWTRADELIARIQFLLAQVTYKPGCKFELLHGKPWHHGLAQIQTRFYTPDIYGASNPNHYIEVQSEDTELAILADRDVLYRIVLAQVRLLEQREMNEWLKVDGVWAVDPHGRFACPVCKGSGLGDTAVYAEDGAVCCGVQCASAK